MISGPYKKRAKRLHLDKYRLNMIQLDRGYIQTCLYYVWRNITFMTLYQDRCNTAATCSFWFIIVLCLGYKYRKE